MNHRSRRHYPRHSFVEHAPCRASSAVHGIDREKSAYAKEHFYRHDSETQNKQSAYPGYPEMLIKSQREVLKELEELLAEDEMNFPEEKIILNNWMSLT